MELRDYTKMNVSAVKTAARLDLMAEFMEFLKSKYETVAEVSANEIGVITGTADDDGFPSDVTCIVKVSVKPWYDKESTKRNTEKYDLLTEAELWELEKKARQSKRKGRPKKTEEE